MANLTSYTLDAIKGDDYTITFTFDDGMSGPQTINWKGVVDDPPGVLNGTTAAQKLDALVRDYAVGYQNGLDAVRQAQASAQALLKAVGGQTVAVPAGEG